MDTQNRPRTRGQLKKNKESEKHSKAKKSTQSTSIENEQAMKMKQDISNAKSNSVCMIQIDLNNDKIDFPGQQPILINDWQDENAKSSDKDKKSKHQPDKIKIIEHQDQDQIESIGYSKKRDYKTALKELQDSLPFDLEIDRRRSSRLEKVSKTPALYTMDKMNQNQYLKNMVAKELKKQEERMVEYAIQRSLLNETKYKDSKELQAEPKNWLKNFVSNSDKLISKDDQIPVIKSKKRQRKEPLNLEGKTIINIDLDSDVPCEFSQDKELREIERELEFEKQEKRKKKQKIVRNDSDFEVPANTQGEKNEKFCEKKKRECQDELQDLIDGSIRPKSTKIQEFLEPFPVKKRGPKIAGRPSIEEFQNDAINPVDFDIRKIFTNFVDFKNQKTENVLYGPALVQKIQQERKEVNPETDEIQDLSQSQSNTLPTADTSQVGSVLKDGEKHHFLKMKQSSCNVKRACGVSYVKVTESQQEGVLDRGYDLLPPITIQGSYTLPPNKGRWFDDDKMSKSIQNLIDYLFYEQDNQVLVVTAFETINEIQMKNYLLKQPERLNIAGGKYFLITKDSDQVTILENLWKFIKDKHFLCIHLKYHSDHLMTSIQLSTETDRHDEEIIQFITESDIQIGILPKRGNASVKSMLKVYKIPDIYEQHMQSESAHQKVQAAINCQGSLIQGINTIAYLSRFELYVSEKQWLKASIRQKWAFNTFINCLEDKMSDVLLTWNLDRTRLSNTQVGTICPLQFQSKTQKLKVWEQWSDLSQDFGKPKIDLIKIVRKKALTQSPMIDPIEILPLLRKNAPVPVTLINTRDCFAYDLSYTEEIINAGKGREKVIKKEYYFNPEYHQTFPENFKQVVGLRHDADMSDINNLKIGVTCYENFFSQDQLNDIEDHVQQTEQRSLNDEYLPMTAQTTYAGGALKRTKFFFGYRYMWTRTQLQDPLSNIAAGVRADVSQPPLWMKEKIEDPMVEGKLVEENFINSVALNVYHDGSEGLAQHFDDATRFKQPIYTLRMFSDSRLSFGSQYYGFQNGAYYIPLPRGCICVMQEGSYSANGVKHCIRPCDMTGKSSAIILRQMHPNVIDEAKKLDRNIDLPMWMSGLSLNDNSTPFYQQRQKECEWIEQQVSGGACNTSKITVQKKLNKDQTSKCNPNASSPPKTVKNQDIVSEVMNKMISRIEAKCYFENDINSKIETMRQKLRSSKQSELVKVFHIERISR